jgi:hypothetical protein
MNGGYKTPAQIQAAYENGLPGWQFRQETMDALMADHKARLFADVAPHLTGIGKGKLALLWRSREKYDPGAFGDESQTTADCVSHGSRSARETTRCVEIHIKGELEEFCLRSATEPTYGARGHGGLGMDPAKATRFESDFGFLFRKKYPFADLSVYDSDIGSRWGRQGVPQVVCDECRKHNVGQWIAPRSTDQVKDLLYSGYALHSGQNFGVSTVSDRRGIAVPRGRWAHDMATVGYDDTREVYPVGVFLIVNSWGRWNQRPKVWPEDRYGPWPVGSFWLAEDVYERFFVGSRSIFAYCDIQGVPQKRLPDYGDLTSVLG